MAPVAPTPQDDLTHRLIEAEAAAKLFGGPAQPVQVGRYRLRRWLGSGGSGTVYAAWDPQLEREVALKVVRAGPTDGLLHEGRLLARLAHPAVVTVHDVGVHEGRGFVAMERIDGPTLRRWAIGRSATEVVAVWSAAGRGLAAAHAAGLVHRDVKADNVILGPDGQPRVVDFGLARWVGDAPERSGTPRYMAPEQHRGAEPDPSSDQYAFAVGLAEALAGVPVFHGDDPARLIEQKEQGPPPLGRVRRRYRAALRRALAPDPTQRFDSLEALLDALAHDPVGDRLRAGVTVVLAGFVVITALGAILQMILFARLMGLSS